ncbi:hypothetical protein, partial [uncultured Alistipes sp.]
DRNVFEVKEKRKGAEAAPTTGLASLPGKLPLHPSPPAAEAADTTRVSDIFYTEKTYYSI